MKAETPLVKQKLMHIIDSFSRIRVEPYHNQEALKLFSAQEIITQLKRIQTELFGEIMVTAALPEQPDRLNGLGFPFDSRALCKAYKCFYKRELIKMLGYILADDFSSKERFAQAAEEVLLQANLLLSDVLTIAHTAPGQSLLSSGRGKESLGA